MSSKPIHTLGILGVRDYRGTLYENSHYVHQRLAEYLLKNHLQPHEIAVVTGGGKGVESIVVEWCIKHKVAVRKIPPNIQEYGQKDAFIVRNNHVVSEVDELLIFWDGQIDILSRSIITAMHQQKMVQVIPIQ
jgi:hypothetical protein